MYVTGNISDITPKCLRSWLNPWQNYRNILELNGDNVFCIIISFTLFTVSVLTLYILPI